MPLRGQSGQKETKALFFVYFRPYFYTSRQDFIYSKNDQKIVWRFCKIHFLQELLFSKKIVLDDYSNFFLTLKIRGNVNNCGKLEKLDLGFVKIII